MSQLQEKDLNNQGGVLMELRGKRKSSGLLAPLAAIAIICLLVGGIVGYGISDLISSNRISDLNSKVSTLENEVSTLESNQNSSSQNVTIENPTYENTTYLLGGNFSLSQLYNEVKNSVVVVEAWSVGNSGFPFYTTEYTEVQGSGFVCNLTGQFVIVTNGHVVIGYTNVTVTFLDGDTYAATVKGSDVYADLAVLSINAPQDEYHPLNVVNSSTLSVGDPVIAVGNPLGLAGSVTSGIVSALGRTITESTTNGYAIADCVQITAPINPGNSGGPLLNYQGEVVGITTAIVTSSETSTEGLGLAIPSNSILREIRSLIVNGSYNEHPWLDISYSPYFGLGTAAEEGYQDLTYEIASAMGTNYTYGVLLETIGSGGPAAEAGLRGSTTQATIEGNSVTIGGDIIIAVNGIRIRCGDDLTAYLEENTSPGQTVNVTVVRNNQTLTLPLTLGARPPPSTSGSST
jgi:S1-C subfamily serine protease